MTHIAYILLAHRHPDGVIRQAELLAAGGDGVAIHYDRNAGHAEFARLRAAVAANPRVVLARRVRGGWGEWSLVQATLNAIRAALAAFPDATHLAMLSGDCMPVRPRAEIGAVLAAGDRDYIEHHDFFESDWIRTGLKEERLIYRHYVNERRRKWLFYTLLDLQRRFGLARTLPEGLRIRIGSQWWVLRRRSVERVLALIRARPDLIRFFRTTWIPDETFFQSLVPHVTPREELANRTQTFLAFSDYGLPLVLHDDHAGLVEGEDAFFARKVSPGAAGLRARLADVYRGQAAPAPRGGAALALYRLTTRRGREGRLHAPRLWDQAASIGGGRLLHVVVAKKWHVARQVAENAGQLGLPAFGHVFDEEAAGLPPLGGYGTGLAKRLRHRRAFLRILFDATGARRLLFCLDPARAEALTDLAADAVGLRVLLIRTEFDDAFVTGHAGRTGLLAPGAEAGAGLVPLLRRELQEEEARVMGAGLRHLVTIREDAGRDAQADALAVFLEMTRDAVLGILPPQGIGS